VTHCRDDWCLTSFSFIKFQWLTAMMTVVLSLSFSDSLPLVFALFHYLSIFEFFHWSVFTCIMAVTVQGTAMSHSHCFGTDKGEWHVGVFSTTNRFIATRTLWIRASALLKCMLHPCTWLIEWANFVDPYEVAPMKATSVCPLLQKFRVRVSDVWRTSYIIVVKKTRFLIIAFHQSKAVFVFRRFRKIAKSDC
jgi:hypothetical protein